MFRKKERGRFCFRRRRLDPVVDNGRPTTNASKPTCLQNGRTFLRPTTRPGGPWHWHWPVRNIRTHGKQLFIACEMVKPAGFVVIGCYEFIQRRDFFCHAEHISVPGVTCAFTKTSKRTILTVWKVKIISFAAQRKARKMYTQLASNRTIVFSTLSVGIEIDTKIVRKYRRKSYATAGESTNWR